MLFPQPRKSEFRHALPGSLRNGATFLFAIKVVFQQLFQVVLVIQDALLAIPEVLLYLSIGALLKEQSPSRGPFKHTLVTLTANAAVEDDARPAQQLPI